ncbi:hypothetical protein AVEN_158956-1 [Araneus ventricosus]|uniref:Reverse transcriptase domain-containing protein n=1 Tax=Araneus ventricosus TaxID=182803 RepID=A0A4Y2BBW0_ARAVE|nr:hypothetical protein AVEN_158956-1 [Araneus ventricosus]
MGKRSPFTPRKRWKLENLKILDFRRDLSLMVSTFRDLAAYADNIEGLVAEFEEGLETICELNVKKKVYRGKSNAIWWSNKLESMRSRVRALRRRFQRTRDPSERLRREVYYKAEYAKYKLMMKQAKQNKFLEFLESVIQKNKLGEVKNVITDKSVSVNLHRLRQENGEFTSSYEETRDYLIKYNFPSIDESYEINLDLLPDSEVMDFETDEIEACITAMRKGAPGIDCWSTEFLEEIFHVDKE